MIQKNPLVLLVTIMFFTLVAKVELMREAFALVVAAVAIVPVTRCDVVVIVADAIAPESRHSAIGFLKRMIHTRAFETVLELLRIASFATAVTTIPAAATVVVIIVAVLVTRVLIRAATAFATLCTFVGCGILAAALVTVPVLATVSGAGAAVATVPITSRIVIRIITESIVVVWANTSRAHVPGVKT